MIKAAKQSTIIWTDHATTIAITWQTSLTTSFTDKLNLHLVQAAAYIQRFRLEIHHKSGKQNTVPNALSRLSCQEAEADEEPILDTLFTKPILQAREWSAIFDEIQQ